MMRAYALMGFMEACSGDVHRERNSGHGALRGRCSSSCFRYTRWNILLYPAGEATGVPLTSAPVSIRVIVTVVVPSPLSSKTASPE